eukprot:TRINITY_DN50770_c0_g1_i1.p1 TRINITY_DN50770_c0_g1~~TRINITY_DN50770_c0_g1_i1.p1  ORF type:complete len:277 (+),score=46.34 TRINITY_DN50770_c0_g1_i1:98-832(+)
MALTAERMARHQQALARSRSLQSSNDRAGLHTPAPPSLADGAGSRASNSRTGKRMFRHEGTINILNPRAELEHYLGAAAAKGAAQGQRRLPALGPGRTPSAAGSETSTCKRSCVSGMTSTYRSHYSHPRPPPVSTVHATVGDVLTRNAGGSDGVSVASARTSLLSVPIATQAGSSQPRGAALQRPPPPGRRSLAGLPPVPRASAASLLGSRRKSVGFDSTCSFKHHGKAYPKEHFPGTPTAEHD